MRMYKGHDRDIKVSLSPIGGGSFRVKLFQSAISFPLRRINRRYEAVHIHIHVTLVYKSNNFYVSRSYKSRYNDGKTFRNDEDKKFIRFVRGRYAESFERIFIRFVEATYSWVMHRVSGFDTR